MSDLPHQPNDRAMLSPGIANIFQQPFLRSIRAHCCIEAAPSVGSGKNK